MRKIGPIFCLLVSSVTWGWLLAEEPQTKGAVEPSSKSAVEPPSPSATATPVLPSTNLSPSSAITPLSSEEKFKLAVHNSVLSPLPYALAGAKAGLSMAIDAESHYKNGAKGYFRRFGDRMGSGLVYELSGTWIAASALHQDPRYYPSPDRRLGQRVKYALSRIVVTRGDDGRSQFNTSNIIGITASATAKAAWYPNEEHRLRHGAASVGTGILFDSVGKLTKEFIRHRH